MTFNKKRYRELLEYSQSLKKNEKHLSKVSKSDFSELLSYSSALYKQLKWEYRDSYSDLMDRFLLNVKIPEEKLKLEFIEIQESQDQVYEVLESNLIILSPNKNSDYVRI